MKQEFKPGDFLHPILPGTAGTDYERYLRTDELLALQKTPEERSHPDELMFQVVHQSSELLMKGAHNELERAAELIEKGDLRFAARLLRRANQFLDQLVPLMHLLDTLTPYDYHIIRAGLGHGSGLQSPGFLNLLSMGPKLGLKFDAAIARAGVTLEEIYRRHEELIDLHDVAEELLGFDQRMQTFRFHHLKLAERIIGPDVIGTGGNPMDILRQRQHHSFYKALWDVRNEITRRVGATYGEPAKGPGVE